MPIWALRQTPLARQTRPSLRALYRHSPTTNPLDEQLGVEQLGGDPLAPVIGGLLRDRVELCIEGEVQRSGAEKDAAVNAVGLAQRALRQTARDPVKAPPGAESWSGMYFCDIVTLSQNIAKYREISRTQPHTLTHTGN